MKTNRIFKQFNWRFLLVRIVVNALALVITALVVPSIYFVDKSIWNWLLMAVMLGVLNALIKPILQYLTLRFIFATFGLVVVLINTLLLWLLSILFPARFAVESILWAVVGGLVLGMVSSFLESLLGLTMPIVPDEPPELRRHLEEQARKAGWLASSAKIPSPVPHPAAADQALPAGDETRPPAPAIMAKETLPDTAAPPLQKEAEPPVPEVESPTEETRPDLTPQSPSASEEERS